MTLAELVEHLKTEDRAVPSSENVHQCLEKANANQMTFEVRVLVSIAWVQSSCLPSVVPHASCGAQIGYIPSSVPDSIVQLQLKVCLNKLRRDLLHVFVCHAAVGRPVQWHTVQSSYTDLCGHLLKPTIYGSQDICGLMENPNVIKSVLQVWVFAH